MKPRSRKKIEDPKRYTIFRNIEERNGDVTMCVQSLHRSKQDRTLELAKLRALYPKIVFTVGITYMTKD